MPINSDGDSDGATASGGAVPEAAVLREMLRVRPRQWLRAWLIAFVVLTLLGLFALPQTYTSTLSLSLQQPGPSISGSGLGALVGLGGGAKTYTGVLRSRRFATAAEAVGHLQQLEHLRSHADAVDEILKDVHIDDNVLDGLVYVSVSLKGPPLLSFAGATRERVRRTAEALCNSYATSLRNYLVYNDTDRDSILRRHAIEQLDQVNSDFNASFASYAAFVRRSNARNMEAVATANAIQAVPIPGSSAATGAPVGTVELQAQLRGIQAEISSLQSAQDVTRQMLTAPGGDIASVSIEDPVLLQERKAYLEAQATYEGLAQQFGPKYPALVRARQVRDVTRTQLQKQIHSVLSGKTSDAVKLKALQTEYVTVADQLTDADRNFKAGRELATRLQLKADRVAINLEKLKAAETKYQELTMDTVSAQSRMTVVDPGRAPRRGDPHFGVLLALCAVLSAMAVGAWAGWEYVSRSYTMAAR
ncbi:MAG: hypothetical protein KGJ62_11625 [Armatimonadetes bacterium]|nr:hypothetical protein [Armatimonadota bacterium]MDE2206776.1 hypothetical protein [Armatimonadota bacterium]